MLRTPAPLNGALGLRENPVPNLELRFPPPLIALTMLPLMWLLSHVLPRPEALSQETLPAALGLAILGFSCAATGAVQFKKAQTTVNPRRPEQTSTLVTQGIYRITRNPMYLGLALLLAGWSACLGSVVSLAGPVAFVVYITRYQIGAEERMLLSKFGEEFENYRSSVRRWI